MRKFRNVGNGPRDLEGYGTVEVGDLVEVDTEAANGLEGQADWEHVPDKKRSQAARKAAATREESGA